MLTKLNGTSAHKGGKLFDAGSREQALLVAWMSQGAPLKDPKAPQLRGIKLAPENCTLQKGQNQQFKVTAIYANGSSKDVSADSIVRCIDGGVAVATGCNVAAMDFGDSAVVASYMRMTAVSRVAVPQPAAGEFPDFPAANKIDEFVLARLKELNIQPSELCTDDEFIRRVYLDVIGVLPTVEETRAFLADHDAKKRSKLIDRLLQRQEFADFWALKWSDLLRIKSEYPINLWPNAVQAYYHWVRDSVARNKPYDQFARELLTATGSNFRDPTVNFYRAVSDHNSQGFAESAALVFMGARLECARCHAHPTENWTPEDHLGMSAFFAKVQFKPTQEWKEEIVFINPDLTLRNPATKQVVTPKFLGGSTVQFAAATSPFSPVPVAKPTTRFSDMIASRPATGPSEFSITTIAKDEDLRAVFAKWLTSPDNPWFARCASNRVWFWLMGRGIVHEVDDIRPTNPPSNPELLAYLEGELVSHHYDLRHVYRLILNSRTYQLSSRTNPSNEKDLTHFSHYVVRRLTAEQLLDAIGQATETSEPFSSSIPEPYTVMPPGFRASQLPDGSIGTPFLELFGRPSRDTPYEGLRDNRLSMQQVLHLLNSEHIDGKIARSPRLTRLLKEKQDPEIVDDIYLSVFSRLPRAEEKKKAVEYLSKDKKTRTQALRDLVWAIFNTKEFLFNH